MKYLISLLLLCLPFTAFAQEQLDIKRIAHAYFDVYAERKDFDYFMSFYDESVVLEDIVYGFLASDKNAVKQFFNWSDPKFSALNNKALVVNQLLIENGQVVAEGYFTRFIYNEQTLGPWRFIIRLTFNEKGKITHQVDWINYTPKAHYLGGKNMNNILSKNKVNAKGF